MFCPKCGTQNVENARFCIKCGKELTIAPINATPIQNPENSSTDENTPATHNFVRPVPQQAPINPMPAPNPPKPPKPPKPKKPYDGKLKIVAPIICILISIGIITGASFGLVAEAKKHEPAPVQDEYENAPTSATLKYDTDKIINDLPVNSFDKEPGTDAQVAQLRTETSKVESILNTAETSLSATYPEINESNLSNYIYDLYYGCYDSFYSSPEIYDVDYSDNCITFELASGGTYIYAPSIEGCDTGEGDANASTNTLVPDFQLEISTYQPCLSGYDSSISTYMSYPDNGATMIDTAFDTYVFNDANNLDDAEVDLSSLYNFQNSNVILWHGHGGFDPDHGSFMVSGIPRSEENDSKYYYLIQNDILLLGSSSYFVGSAFFDFALSDGALDNTIIYLGTCSSGRDARLAQTLLDKGAAAVYANSNTIHTTYNLSMIQSVAEGLTKTHSNGMYYTVEDALEYAKDEHGTTDWGSNRYTEVRLYTDDDTFSLDWYENHVTSDRSIVLVLDNSGSMSGTPLQETIDASNKFVETVTAYNAQVGIVTFDSYANRACNFTVRQPVLSETINDMYPGSTTNIHAGLQEAKSMLDETNSSKKIIVLMTDGLPNIGLCGDDLINYAESLKDEGIIIYALGFFHDLSQSDKSEPQRLLEGIATSGCHYEIDNSDDVVFFFDDVASQINGQKYVYIKIACPVDVIVKYNGETLSTKGNKNRTSFGSISYENARGNTNSSKSDKDDLAKVVRLLDGVNYEIEIVATDDGSMDYTIAYMDENGDYTDTREFSDIALTDKTIINTQTGKSEKTLVSVDQDGDGKVDVEYEASENGEAKEVDHTIETICWIVIALAAFVILVCTLVIVLKVTKHKKWKATQNV